LNITILVTRKRPKFIGVGAVIQAILDWEGERDWLSSSWSWRTYSRGWSRMVM